MLTVSLCLFPQIPKRLYKALSLLKKEYELSKLQQRLGREVLSNHYQMNYFPNYPLYHSVVCSYLKGDFNI